MPALFEGLCEGVPERGVTQMPVKQAGLALPDASQTAPENWTASCVIKGHLVAAFRGQVEFRTADHSACLREGWTAVRQQGQWKAEEALTAAMEGDLVSHARQLQRATKTGAWLTVQPSIVNVTELGAQEWRDALFQQYGLEPLYLPTHCDGCQYKLSRSHALDCKKGGLVMARYNKFHDGVADLAGKAFIPPPRARRPPYLLRLRRKEDVGCANWGRRNHQTRCSAAARGQRTEGRPYYLGPLEARNRQCSRHACREH